MNECPVCQSEIKDPLSACPVCDADLHMLAKMEQLPAVFKQMAEIAETENDLPLAMSYTNMGLDLEPHNSELLSAKAKLIEKQTQTNPPVILPKKRKVPVTILGIVLALIAGWTLNTVFKKKAITQVSLPSLEKKPMTMVKPPIKDIENIIKEISQKQPNKIEYKLDQGGIFLTGQIQYNWDKKYLENKVKESHSWKFVDMTGTKVLMPEAFYYRVKEGDTLCRLARLFTGSQKEWNDFFNQNRHLLENPHQLKIGQTIILYTKKYPK